MLYLKDIIILIPIILSIALITLAERKIMGSIQRRIGPNVVGIFGLIQPITDGIKLILKEGILPIKTSNFYFTIAPLSTFLISLLLWLVIPFKLGIIIVDLDLSILFIFALSTLTIYGILYGGWSSESKYGYIGAIRATAQLISYEVSIGIILISIIAITNSINLHDQYFKQIITPIILTLWPIFILFFISLLAETNRTPFDLLEAESELVAGFLVEYSSIIFVAYYLAEYSMILFWSFLLTSLFLPSFFLSYLLFIFLFIWVRASLPRLRYDQLMKLGWASILPLSISSFLFFSSFIFLFN